MTTDGPGVILYGSNSKEVTVVDGKALLPSQPVLPIAGVNSDGYAEAIKTNNGSISVNTSVRKTERYEKITVGINDTIYYGFAVPGSAETDPVWTIKRILMVNGFPSTGMVSNENVVWSDRTIITYY